MAGKKELVTFSRGIASTLVQMAKSFSGGSSSIDAFPKTSNQTGLWLMQARTTITAAAYNCDQAGDFSGPTPGSGKARLCYREKLLGKVMPYKPNGKYVEGTVYNLLKESIPENRYFLASRDLAGTIWVEQIFRSCEGGSGSQGSGGSGGSGPGSGDNCIDVVTQVSFDPYTCKLIVCTRNICFPPGTIIGPEDCGSGGSGGY
jgi:hypothetical protein